MYELLAVVIPVSRNVTAHTSFRKFSQFKCCALLTREVIVQSREEEEEEEVKVRGAFVVSTAP